MAQFIENIAMIFVFNDVLKKVICAIGCFKTNLKEIIEIFPLHSPYWWNISVYVFISQPTTKHLFTGDGY